MRGVPRLLFPQGPADPWRPPLKRLGIATGIVVIIAALALIGRDGHGHRDDDGLWRHRTHLTRRPGHHRLRGDALERGLPRRPRRHDTRTAHRTIPSIPGGGPLEENDARPHDRRRLRHDAPPGRRDIARQRHHVDRPCRRHRLPGGGDDERAGSRADRDHGADATRTAAWQQASIETARAVNRDPQPGRHGDTRHAYRPPAQSHRADLRRRARVRERSPAQSVRGDDRRPVVGGGGSTDRTLRRGSAGRSASSIALVRGTTRTSFGELLFNTSKPMMSSCRSPPRQFSTNLVSN
jgi:hypothetical protein